MKIEKILKITWKIISKINLDSYLFFIENLFQYCGINSSFKNWDEKKLWTYYFLKKNHKNTLNSKKKNKITCNDCFLLRMRICQLDNNISIYLFIYF